MKFVAYTGIVQFETRPRHLLSCLRIYALSFSLQGTFPVQFSIHCHPIIRLWLTDGVVL